MKRKLKQREKQKRKMTSNNSVLYLFLISFSFLEKTKKGPKGTLKNLMNKLFTAEDFTVDTSEPNILASEAVFVIVPAHNLDILMAIGICEDDGLGSIEV